jgi:SAM-dependent methyltransferase
MDQYFSGERLWGDDLDIDDIDEWFGGEREGYALINTAERVAGEGTYGHHLLNTRYGFRFLPPGRIGAALGIGSAFGHEFQPLVGRINELTILEPSSLRETHVGGLPIRYVEPESSGDLPFTTASFDLVTGFGVLHHIPNVSHVVREVGRVTKPGGWFLSREPIVSMGDWRNPRRGLTKNERGIPKQLYLRAVASAGFQVVSATLCLFPAHSRLAGFGLSLDTKRGLALDRVLCAATGWNDRYHPLKPWQKAHPTSLSVAMRRI